MNGVSKTDVLDISVIVPFRNKASMTLDCVRSLLSYGPTVKEVLLVSNNSSKQELGVVREYAEAHDNVVLHEYNKPFNYHKINNWAVRKSSGSTLLFLNNDAELREQSRGLIELMYAKACNPKVGVVGCLLLYGDERTLQHAGVFLVPGGLADHMYAGEKYASVLRLGGTSPEYPYSITKDRPLTAVTAAVSMVEKKKFLSVGGYDERFIVCGGDVDLCIRLNKVDCQTWLVSDGGKYLLHKESMTRSLRRTPYNDFYRSYFAYLAGYDTKKGDPFLPKISALKEIKNED